MVRQVDAIFSQGAFQPVEPVTLPEGTRVRLSVEEAPSAPASKIRTLKLAHQKDAADFAMEVREADDAGV